MRHIHPSTTGLFSLTICSIVFAAGCSGGDFDDDRALTKKEAASEYALETKHEVLQFAETYREDPETARNTFSDIAEGLEVWESEEVGSHGGTYEQIVTIFQQLQENYDQPEKVDQLKSLAESLPGDLEAYRKELAELAD
jgi:hypothetical protein